MAALAMLATGCRSSGPAQQAASGDSSPGGPAQQTTSGGGSSVSAEQARVLSGLEVLVRDSLHLVRGKRIGLITNQTALTSTGEHAVDLLVRTPGVRLVALYGPEHGVRGDIEAGAKIENATDAKTGLPVYSLYGRTQRPTAEMLRDVDVLVFDIQDIGARPYTFVWTMVMAMEVAAARKLPFVVLDRPNPITDRIDGPQMAWEIKRDTIGQPITGYFPVPLRHGMTSGEVARYVNQEYRIGADLRIVPAAGWRSDVWFDRTGLPWVNPSPNIRSLDAALKYSGLVLAEATNLTVGRGTEAPFSYLGAPWMDAPRVVAAAQKYGLKGVRLDTVRFVPNSPDPKAWVPFRGKSVRAVRVTVTDRETIDPPAVALVLLSEIRRAHPDSFKVTNNGFTQMIGSRWARQAFDRGDDPRQILARWEQETREWTAVRDRYRLYPRGGAR